MQDYNYLWHGCMEITLEISCCKYPPAHELPKYWQDNKEVRISYTYNFITNMIKETINKTNDGATE